MSPSQTAEPALHVGIQVPTMYLEAIPPPRFLRTYVERVDELGFDSGWVGDHLLWRCPILESLMALSYVATASETLSFGTDVLLFPLRQPAYLIRQLTSLSHLLADRLLVGVGIGGENPTEWEAAGVQRERRGRIADDIIDALRHYWASDEAFSRPHLRLPAGDFRPRSDSQPPLLIGGRSEPAQKRAALRGDGWLPTFITAPSFEKGVANVHAQRTACGRDDRPFVLGTSILVNCNEDGSLARKNAASYTERFYGIDFSRFEKYTAVGDPAEVTSYLGQFISRGAQTIVLEPVTVDPREQLEILGQHVLPELRAMAPGEKRSA